MNDHSSLSGFSTLELLIAFSVGMSFLSAAMMLVTNDDNISQLFSLHSDNAIALNISNDSIGIFRTRENLNSTLALLRENWHETISTTTNKIYGFEEQPAIIADISPCLKLVAAHTIWNASSNNPSYSFIPTLISNQKTLQALGEDCDALPIKNNWNTPQLISSFSSSSARFNAIDVLNPVIYTSDSNGNLNLFTNSNPQGMSAVISSTFSTGVLINDIDVARWTDPLSGVQKTFAYLMRHATSTQLEVVDVTDTTSPVTSPTSIKKFNGSNPPRGSFPQGWKLVYFDKFIYALTRETAGFEFHIFNVQDPLNPLEIGPGLELNGTANDIAVIGLRIGGAEHRLLFLATERAAAEIMVLDVTNPLAPNILTTLDLPTNLDALSVYALGNKLFVGRQQFTNGPELIMYDVTFSTTTPLIVSFKQAGQGINNNGSITSIRATNNLLFLSTSLANDSFQIWKLNALSNDFIRVNSNPSGISRRITGEIDYAHPYIYATGGDNSALQVMSGSP